MSKNKNKKTNNNSSKILSVAILLVIAFCGGFFAAQKISDATNENRDQNQEIGSKEIAGNSGEVSGVENPDGIDEVEDAEKKTVTQYDGGDPNVAEELNGFVTYAGYSGDNYSIRISIDQYLTSGTCRIELGDYSESANIIPNASNSTCEGFDISSSLIGSNGSFSIYLESDGRTGVISGVIE